MGDGEIVSHAVWADTPHSACVLYERTPVEDGVICRRIEFPPHVVEGDPVSTAEALAQNISGLGKWLRLTRLGGEG
jgi:hypothetical protein